MNKSNEASERLTDEALRALIDARDIHDDRGVLCITSLQEDQSWGMSISICEPFDTDKIVKALAAEVLELRAKLEAAEKMADSIQIALNGEPGRIRLLPSVSQMRPSLYAFRTLAQTGA